MRASAPVLSGSSADSGRSWRSVSMESEASTSPVANNNGAGSGNGGGASNGGGAPRSFKVAMPPSAAAAPAADTSVEAKLAALDAECERQVAAVKADYAARKQKVLEAARALPIG